VNPLEPRKQLLIAESEFNHVQMQEEWQAMTDGVRSLADRVKTASSLAPAAALLVPGLAAFRRGKSVSTDAKPSWFQTALKSAQAAGFLWLAFRARAR
jgi:hypothetical protein